MTTPTPPHLRFNMSQRGLLYLPAIGAIHGGRPAGWVEVQTSSSGDGNYLWLTVSQPVNRNNPSYGEPIRARIHVPTEEAWKLADQIRFLADQQGARPDWATP